MKVKISLAILIKDDSVRKESIDALCEIHQANLVSEIIESSALEQFTQGCINNKTDPLELHLKILLQNTSLLPTLLQCISKSPAIKLFVIDYLFSVMEHFSKENLVEAFSFLTSICDTDIGIVKFKTLVNVLVEKLGALEIFILLHHQNTKASYHCISFLFFC